MKIPEFKEAVRNVLRERSINAISKLQQKNIENIAKALDFYKKNKHTDKKEPFIKLLKKLGKEKIALAKELDMKVSGMYKNAEYKGENTVMNHDGKSAPYGSGYESVNEILTIVDKFDAKKQDYDKMYYKDGGDRPGDGDLKKAKKELAKLSKKHKGLTLVSVGRNSKMYDVMKADESVVNEMSMGFDSMTGLFYLKGVPFTRERVKEVLQFFMKSKAKSAVNQFEYTPSLIVKDKVGRHEVTIDPKNLKTLVDFYI